MITPYELTNGESTGYGYGLGTLEVHGKQAIAHGGGRLFARGTNQPENEIFAESETEFFLKVVDAKVTFGPGENGGPPSLVLHLGGRDVPGVRKD